MMPNMGLAINLGVISACLVSDVGAQLSDHLSHLTVDSYLVEYEVDFSEVLQGIDSSARPKLSPLGGILRYPPNQVPPPVARFLFVKSENDLFRFSYEFVSMVGGEAPSKIVTSILYDGTATWTFTPPVPAGSVATGGRRYAVATVRGILGDARSEGQFLHFPDSYIYPVFCGLETSVSEPYINTKRRVYHESILESIDSQDRASVPTLISTKQKDHDYLIQGFSEKNSGFYFQSSSFLSAYSFNWPTVVDPALNGAPMSVTRGQGTNSSTIYRKETLKVLRFEPIEDLVTLQQLLAVELPQAPHSVNILPARGSSYRPLVEDNRVVVPLSALK
ncbi:hypothetical protein GC173_17745 [bacterium]|nr:hypothetical protein [bacterium]